MRAICLERSSGCDPKNEIASSTLMFRMSSMFLPLNLTSRMSGLKRLPPHVSQTIVTSAMNCIGMRTKPSP